MKTKILYALDNYKTANAGTEKQVFNLISNLDTTKFEPHLLVFEDSAYLNTRAFPCDYTVVKLKGIRNISSWMIMLKAAYKFKQKGFKLVHTFFIDTSIICPPVFSLFGIKVIISRRDMGYWYNSSYKRLLKITGNFVSAVTTNSIAVKAITSTSEGIAENKIHVIYNGYELDRKEDAHPAHDIADNKLIIVLVANVRPLKRIGDMLDALKIIVDKFPTAHFVHIGDGDTAQLRAKAEANNIQKNCSFLGKRTNVLSYLKKAHVGVLCSESEGFSNSILEYQLSGLPVVCSNVGGNPEAVIEGENGYLYQAGNVQELASKLIKLLSNPKEMELMGARAKANALAKYDIKSTTKYNQELYLKLL